MGVVVVPLLLSMVGGLSTSLGALLVVLMPPPNLNILGILQGFAGGLMLSISLLDLVHNAINSIGFLKANLWFFSGVIVFAAVVAFIPEPVLSQSNELAKRKEDKFPAGKDLMKKKRRDVFFTGVVTAIGISMHNFPEGIAVFLGSIKGLRVGISLAVAIAVHNIPEGIAVALPIYFATESKWRAFKIASLSGLAEPLGVILVAYLFPNSISPETLEGLLSAVGGVMAFITLHEMVPLAFEYAGHQKAVIALFVGMAVMSFSLHLLEMSMPPGVSL